MVKKFLEVLKPLLKDKGLSKEEIESLANLYGKNLTETSTDEEIDNLAKSVVPFAEIMQKSASRQVTAAREGFKDFKSPKDVEALLAEAMKQKEGEGGGEKDSLTLEQVQDLISKAVVNETKELKDKIAEYEAKEKSSQLRSQLYAHSKVKDIPDFFRSHYSLDKEEDIEAVASKIETDYATMKQKLVQQEGFVEKPKAGGIGETDDLIARMHKMAEDASASK